MKIKSLNKNNGKEEITKIDEYINHLTPYYMSLFLKDKKINIENFLNLMKESVIEPTENQIEIVNISMEKINESLKTFNMNIDIDMTIIYTNGEDNIGMPYTKGTSMIMPSGYHYPESGVLNYLNPHLVAHELWHILSRNNEELRKSAYESLGFKKNDKKLNEIKNYNDFLNGNSIDDIYFINPDAISHDYYFEMIEGDKKIKMFPIMVQNLIPAAIYVDGDEIINIDRLYTERNKSYIEEMKNFDYNTHPEEICAEHFRCFIMSNYENELSLLPNQEMMKNFIKTIKKEFGIKNKNKLNI